MLSQERRKISGKEPAEPAEPQPILAAFTIDFPRFGPHLRCSEAGVFWLHCKFSPQKHVISVR